MTWRARVLSLLVGFLSLSQEILWVRMAGFITRGLPQTFGGVLGLYLIGIAVGAGIGARYCKSSRDLLGLAGAVLLVAGGLDFFFPWFVAFAVRAGLVPGVLALAVSVIVTSALKSIVFPIAHQLGSTVTDNTVGSSVSKVYFANIIGSTLGPLVTGFVLLNVLGMQQCLMLMAGVSVIIGAWCLLRADRARFQVPAMGVAVVATVGALAAPNFLIHALVEGTHPKGAIPVCEGPIKNIVENRYGIIHMLESTKGDCVFGGNAYDGRINVDYLSDGNAISRVYVLAALQPAPKRILVIGMSAGAWTRVLEAFPGVEHIDVVEINPGYTEITARYPLLEPLLHDPRVSIHFDDGRRWLKRHPSDTYDLMVMNTTFHWRAYSSMLLSRDFLEVMREHLNEGGVLAYNSTHSEDVFETASAVFKTVYRYTNFVVAGDSIQMPETDVAVSRIAALRLDGRPLVDGADPAVAAKLRTDMAKFEPYVKGGKGEPRAESITDQNMLSEYRHNPLTQKMARALSGKAAPSESAEGVGR